MPWGNRVAEGSGPSVPAHRKSGCSPSRVAHPTQPYLPVSHTLHSHICCHWWDWVSSTDTSSLSVRHDSAPTPGVLCECHGGRWAGEALEDGECTRKGKGRKEIGGTWEGDQPGWPQASQKSSLSTEKGARPEHCPARPKTKRQRGP